MERNFSSLATGLGGMVRRTARLRDKGDRIVKTLQDFASAESGEMKKSLEGVADCFSAMEDCNHLKVRISCGEIHDNQPFPFFRLTKWKQRLSSHCWTTRLYAEKPE